MIIRLGRLRFDETTLVVKDDRVPTVATHMAASLQMMIKPNCAFSSRDVGYRCRSRITSDERPTKTTRLLYLHIIESEAFTLLEDGNPPVNADTEAGPLA